MPAVIVGLDSITGLQATRILTDRGIDVIGIAHDKRHFACRTRLCQRILMAPPGGPELISVLEGLAGSLVDSAVLVPCTDLAVAAISEHRVRLDQIYAFQMPAHGVVMRLMDKTTFVGLAEDLGIAVPRTMVLSERRDAEEAAASLQFPVVLKPGLKRHDWQARAGAKVLMARDPGALLDLYDRFNSLGGELIGQEWVGGADDELYTCNAYFAAGGRLVASFVSRKIRQWPPRNGTGCLAVDVRNDDVLDMTKRLFASVEFHGLAYLEVKRDLRTGNYLAIEPNVGRPTGRSAAAELADVELLMSSYQDSLGEPLPEPRAQSYQGTKWIYLRRDLQSSVHEWRRGRLTVRAWLRSMSGVKADAVWSARDPLPFAFDLIQSARKLLPRRLGGRRREDEHGDRFFG